MYDLFILIDFINSLKHLKGCIQKFHALHYSLLTFGNIYQTKGK